MTRIATFVVTLVVCAACAPYLLAQQGWNREGALRRFTGDAIVSEWSGCQPPPGNPVVEIGGSLMEVDLQDGTTIKKNKPEGNWVFVPRQPKLMAQVTRTSESGGTTTVAFYDTWLGSQIASVTAEVNTEALQLDMSDTWVAGDGSEGCLVFSPVESTPEGSEEYVAAFFEGTTVTFILRVKPKVDLDLYVRPGSDSGTLCYIRGNGISFPPSTEEVFTNASYLVYQSNGRREQLPLPQRGPGSGKGRTIIWHSNKWDRLLFTDEAAGGALLVKASNGIVVDSITTVSIDPGPMKVLSASGNINDRWMTTHAKVGSKNALILWAMPETVETEVVLFSESDPARKQMPLAPWSIVVPFVSSNGGANTLFSWDPQDVVSVSEDGGRRTEDGVWPNPAKEIVNIVINADGACRFVLVNAAGMRVEEGTANASEGRLSIDTSMLESGIWSMLITTANNTIHHQRFVINR